MIFRIKNNIILSVGSWSWEKDYFFHLITHISSKRIYVFSSNYVDYKSAREHTIKFKPDIIVHLSDEWGGKKEYDELSKITKLYLRQYFHQEYPKHNNKYVIPLGYQTGMFDRLPTNINHKPIIERKYKWSFIGDYTKNQERYDMVNYMKSIKPHKLGKAEPLEMKDIYCDSIFVPNVRGNVKLDCFRLYEATACGAIPVLVGPMHECRELIQSQQMPPWPYYDNWCDVKTMIENYDEDKIQILQEKNIIWWNSRLQFIIDKIAE